MTGRMLSFYIDGELVSETSYSGRISPMLRKSFLAIGSEDGRTTCPGCIDTRYFGGLIDEVKIFNRALSVEEIKTEIASTPP